jgi:hypothetical protein
LDAIPVIYRARITDPEKRSAGVVSRYSLTPFEKLVVDPIPTGQTRKPYAILDVCYQVEGTWPGEPRRNQLRDTFLEPGNDSDTPFSFARDFIPRYQTSPAFRIYSPLVNDVIRKLVQYYPGWNLEQAEVVHEYPWQVLIHYRDQLCQIRDGYDAENPEKRIAVDAFDGEFQCSKSLFVHLRQILKLMDDFYYQATVIPELRLHENGKATFNNLWLLYKPGDIVFANIRGEVAGFVVWRVLLKIKEDNVELPGDKLQICLWNLGYTGEKLTRRAANFFIERFKGERDIATLDVFPIKYLKDGKTSQKSLIDRGKRYYEIICNLPAYRMYDGATIDETPQNASHTLILTLL